VCVRELFPIMGQIQCTQRQHPHENANLPVEDSVPKQKVMETEVRSIQSSSHHSITSANLESEPSTEDIIDAVVRENESERLHKIRKYFNQYDADGNGRITEDELEQLLRGLFRPTKGEIRTFTRNFAQHDDLSEITFEDFRAGMQKMSMSYGYDASELNIEKLRRKFNEYDTDGSGTINGAELVKLARDNLRIPKEVKLRAMLLFDKDQDGCVSFEEFAETMDRLNWNVSKLWKRPRKVAAGRSQLSQ